MQQTTAQTSRKATRRALQTRAALRDDRYELSPGIKAARDRQSLLRLKMQLAVIARGK